MFLWLCKYCSLVSQIVYYNFFYKCMLSFIILSFVGQRVYPCNFFYFFNGLWIENFSAVQNILGTQLSFFPRDRLHSAYSCRWVCSNPVIPGFPSTLLLFSLLSYVSSLSFHQLSERDYRSENLYPIITADCVGYSVLVWRWFSFQHFEDTTLVSSDFHCCCSSCTLLHIYVLFVLSSGVFGIFLSYGFLNSHGNVSCLGVFIHEILDKPCNVKIHVFLSVLKNYLLFILW